MRDGPQVALGRWAGWFSSVDHPAERVVGGREGVVRVRIVGERRRHDMKFRIDIIRVMNEQGFWRGGSDGAAPFR